MIGLIGVASAQSLPSPSFQHIYYFIENKFKETRGYSDEDAVKQNL